MELGALPPVVVPLFPARLVHRIASRLIMFKARWYTLERS